VPYEDAPRLPETGVIEPHALFEPRAEAVELEIGPGRGGFLFERLLAEPRVCLLGLEIRRKWATIVDRRLRERGFAARARVFAEDARAVVPRISPGSLAAVYLHFPDPWWKKRHQKRLLVTGDFVSSITSALRPRGELFIQTDVRERAEAYERTLSLEPRLAPVPDELRAMDNPFGARSPREKRALSDGLPVYRVRFVRSA
jgi:tRNA (guanine-N7-)-methyltransferase